MTFRVYKITLSLAYEQKVFVHAGADLLCAREQRDELCVWYRCDPANGMDPRGRIVRVVRTGYDAAPDAANSKYLGTAVFKKGELVFHVFETPKGQP